MKRIGIVYLSLVLGALTGCATPTQQNGRDATLLIAFAVSTERANQLGSRVAPDKFVVYAEIALPERLQWKKGDIFYASIDVGTDPDSTKYGSNGALKFTLLSDPRLWIDDARVGYLFPGIHQPPPHPDYNYAHVRAAPLQIHCNKQNQIVYTAAGLSRDDIKLRARTSNTITIKQGKTWLGEYSLD